MRRPPKKLIALATIKAPMHHTTDGDYAGRIIVGRLEVSVIVAALATSIDYSNFKNRIHDTPDQEAKLPALVADVGIPGHAGE